ncbi:MAG: 1-acyl-sn-glycerol-3-phosphate acyltransferase [Sphingobacteriales bacterium]|nr:1-acyl-sn-glycerol-3-phosphate acyltransferase [Sphingobacteriales bacterium]MBI3719864.1 1-acyl-sn-glycerol-3-phosphate acyltransferase [Sphingobacteriales bacterium]
MTLTGWKISGRFPYEIKKAVIIVAPHTSWRDVVIGLMARSVLQLKTARFLGKKELFDVPFGFFFRWMGGIPVDRFSKHNMVDQVVQLFNETDALLLGLSPEGTRGKVDRLRTGFYHIAKKAGVPIIMVGFDFKKKEIIFAEPFYAGDDEAIDFKHIINFFAPVQGYHPEMGLGHLG